MTFYGFKVGDLVELNVDPANKHYDATAATVSYGAYKCDSTGKLLNNEHGTPMWKRMSDTDIGMVIHQIPLIKSHDSFKKFYVILVDNTLMCMPGVRLKKVL